MRGCLARSLVISDLVCSSALVPDKSKMICAVLRKGNAQKEKHTNDRVVGCWRHKVWEMRGIGSLAMLPLHKLNTDENWINFFWSDRTQHANWHKKVFNFRTLDQQYQATSQVIKAIGLNSNKVTHHCQGGMEYGGHEGLSPHQTGTMSKHIVDKWSRYMPEIEKA